MSDTENDIERQQRKAAKKEAKRIRKKEEEQKEKDTRLDTTSREVTDDNNNDNKSKKRKNKEVEDVEEEKEEIIEKKEKKSKNSEESKSSHHQDSKEAKMNGTKLQSDFNEAQVTEFRKKNTMTVTGTGSEYPNFKPCRTFIESGISANVLKACAGFTIPTPIQAQAWPIILAGRDCIGIAETGSGKTLAFSLPGVVHLLNQKPLNTKSLETRGPLMLVLAPTRELAMQISEVTSKTANVVNLNSTVVYGGVDKNPQVKAMRNGCHLLVATPGRLLGLISEGDISLSKVSFFVLDEADRMLDMGFIPDIKRIVATMPAARQTVMFSATWPDEVQKIAKEFLVNPVRITIGSEDLAANVRITQTVEVTENKFKDSKLEALLRKYHIKGNKIIIFCLYKKEAARVEQFLQQKGFNAVAIHGDKGQGDRTGALDNFKTGKIPLLVATDVAARGLDIPNVEYVINYTFPLTIEDYVHRIGRTGRAGKTGNAYTFFTPEDKAHSGTLINILKEANQSVPEGLAEFGVFTKKKSHGLYGDHFKDMKAMPAATKITFDD